MAAVLFEAVLVVVTMVLSLAGVGGDLSGLSFVLAIVLFPVLIALAILRYRLYDIDVVIRKTLVYTCLIAMLALLYLGGIALLGAAFRSATGQSGALAVTLSTLTVAFAFQPLRRRIQHAVDRRFSRRTYDAEAAVQAFTGRLREQIDQPLKPKSTRATCCWASRTKIGPLSRIHESSSSISSNSIRADSIRRTSPSCSVRTSISTGSNSATAFATAACCTCACRYASGPGPRSAETYVSGRQGQDISVSWWGSHSGGMAKSVVAWCAGHPGLLILGPAAPSWSGLCNYPPMADSIEVNRAYWDERVAAHAASPEYAVARFAEDPAHLSEVVRFDLPRLGDVDGLELVHLQCHIGTDTLSLAPARGADDRPGLLRPRARVARAAGRATPARRSTTSSAELYDAVGVLGGERFDLVYTGIGALCWLPESAGGRRSSPACCAPAGGCSSARATRCCGRSDDPRPTGCW